MVQSTHSRRLLTVTVIAVALLTGACSKDKSTGPPSGGGGGLELNSANLGHNGVYMHTFPATLTTYNYHCKIHSVMTASVTVSSGGPASASVTITDNAFGPTSVTIGPSGSVTWTNNGSNTHTVTSD
jgi:hypothetical protein